MTSFDLLASETCCGAVRVTVRMRTITDVRPTRVCTCVSHPSSVYLDPLSVDSAFFVGPLDAVYSVVTPHCHSGAVSQSLSYRCVVEHNVTKENDAVATPARWC